MSEILAQAVDICRKLIGEKTTPDVSEIDSAITNITYIPMFKDVDQSILKDMLLSLYTTKVDEGVSKCTPSLFYVQSPDFHKLGLCYYLKILYL